DKQKTDRVWRDRGDFAHWLAREGPQTALHRRAAFEPGPARGTKGAPCFPARARQPFSQISTLRRSAAAGSTSKGRTAHSQEQNRVWPRSTSASRLRSADLAESRRRLKTRDRRENNASGHFLDRVAPLRKSKRGPN